MPKLKEIMIPGFRWAIQALMVQHGSWNIYTYQRADKCQQRLVNFFMFDMFKLGITFEEKNANCVSYVQALVWVVPSFWSDIHVFVRMLFVQIVFFWFHKGTKYCCSLMFQVFVVYWSSWEDLIWGNLVQVPMQMIFRSQTRLRNFTFQLNQYTRIIFSTGSAHWEDHINRKDIPWL